MARKLLQLNGLAVLGVVLNHATGWGFTAMFWWTDRYAPVQVPSFDQLGGAPYFTLRGIEQLVSFTVPSFLFVSGFFIAFVLGRGAHTEDWSLVRSRIVVLLVPYLLWSALILSGRAAEGQHISAADAFTSTVFGRAAPPFYYIPLLVQLYLLAPLLVAVAKQHWMPLLAASTVLQLSTHTLQYFMVLGMEGTWLTTARAAFPVWSFPTKILWFVLGIVVCLHLQQVRPWLVRTRRWWMLGLVTSFAAGIWEWEVLLRASGRLWLGYFDTAVDGCFALAFIACFIAHDRMRWPLPARLGELGAMSYGVYLVHSPVQEYAARAIAKLAPVLLAHQVTFQPVLWAVGLAVPLALMKIVRETPARRFYRSLFG